MIEAGQLDLERVIKERSEFVIKSNAEREKHEYCYEKVYAKMMRMIDRDPEFNADTDLHNA